MWSVENEECENVQCGKKERGKCAVWNTRSVEIMSLENRSVKYEEGGVWSVKNEEFGVWGE